MGHVAPLIQTLLWVGLIGAVFYRFHSGIGRLLDALAKRIDAGSGLKAGPFEISELIPQDPKEQSERLDAEIKQITQPENADTLKISTNNARIEYSALKSQAIQAEDLALRQIQAEFGVAVGRQLQTGDLRFDGFFAIAGKAHIVEIKFTQKNFSKTLFKNTVDNLIGSISRYGWKNYKIIFVIVYVDNNVSLSDESARLSEAVDLYESKVELRLFSILELREKSGISD